MAIEKSVDPATPMIVADFSRLVQILYNLTGNSLKFTHKGYVRLVVRPSISTGKVVVQVRGGGGRPGLCAPGGAAQHQHGQGGGEGEGGCLTN